ncbi:DUF1836 domain-containing protein [Proteiniclasticum sp. BAD-10]|uniref:DUF1836 domain-containing protein n=1 Tax=Proteiniclasticum sediminis TaxID=2804028 RepID=A0A941CQI2_9CLOT|nr:DUF1836 domain-containing protein [Proteiniclasticum sediminis]MBR0577040.1 DUF1836 domain-containing protein [Proteiniclasticum sediminis]
MGEIKETGLHGVEDTMQIKARSAIIPLEEFPKYDLFLSQVIEFIEDLFQDESYTVNIIQNYIKSEVISKPYQGKKKGYTKLHLIQLVFVSYMRPVLSTEEIKKVFQLAFNEINNREDDIIPWETAYDLFYEIQTSQMKNTPNIILDEERLRSIVESLKIKQEDKERIHTFITVLALIAKASFIKSTAKELLKGK